MWSRYNLSLLGRFEVARQVMASCLVSSRTASIPDITQPIRRCFPTFVFLFAFVLGVGVHQAG